MNSVKKEIKEALLGDLVPFDKKLVVSGVRRTKFRNGLRDGFQSVLFFGVMCSRRWYMTKKSGKQIRELAVKAMQDMGRIVMLSTLPESEAVYCTYLLNHPAILTFTQGRDGVIEVAAYSARDLSGMLAAYRTLNHFQKLMGNALERMSEEGEQKKQNAIREQSMQEKQAAKQAKLNKKQARKQEKSEKKQARRQNSIWNLLRKGAVNTDGVAQVQKPAQAQNPVQEQTEAGYVEAQAAAKEARLAAEAAEAKLAAAEARLAAEQAEARLANMQEQLAAVQEAGTVATNSAHNHNSAQSNKTNRKKKKKKK